MNIIAAIKQVPDTNDVRIDPETGTLIREGVPSIVNPEDRNAVEMALTLIKQAGKGKLTVLTMGPMQAEFALRELLAMGADEAILLSDRAFAGADTLATASAIFHAIKQIGKFDIILCGRQAIDGDTAQVGPQLAEFLGIPQVTYVKSAAFEGDHLRIERAMEGETQILYAPCPVLLTCLKEANVPRIPTLNGCIEAFREKPLQIWNNRHINAPSTQIGLNGSPTQVRRTFTPQPHGEGIVFTGDSGECVDKTLAALREKGVL